MRRAGGAWWEPAAGGTPGDGVPGGRPGEANDNVPAGWTDVPRGRESGRPGPGEGDATRPDRQSDLPYAGSAVRQHQRDRELGQQGRQRQLRAQRVLPPAEQIVGPRSGGDPERVREE